MDVLQMKYYLLVELRTFMTLFREIVYSFKSRSKMILIKKNNSERTVEVNRNVLGLLVRLSLCSGQPVDFENALRYPISPIPLSIAKPDGERRETTKSKPIEVIWNKTRNPNLLNL